MPKRGGSRGRNWRNDDHFERDDRGHENIRRVSFKPGAPVKDRYQMNKGSVKMWSQKMKLLEDDVDMMTNALESRVHIRGGHRGRGGRLNSPVPRMNHHQPPRKFHVGTSPWYQIIIPYGSNHSKEVILKALLSHIEPLDSPFLPLYYKINGNAAIFYVDDVKIAEKLFYTDRKVLLPDGFRMIVKVRNHTPMVDVDNDLKEKMKTAMARRYNPTNKAMDLTKFHADPDLTDVFCALARPSVMSAIINIIAENIPDLEALNLNDNKLTSFDHIKGTIGKLKSLKILYLADNRIPFISALTPLRCLPSLMELNLKGNPLVTKFSDDHDAYKLFSPHYCAMSYVFSNVRKRFNKLVKLDEVELPPMIGFDVDEAVLPPRQPSFLVDPQGMNIVRTFLTQYFAIYDSDSRQPLLDAYHENACMSLCANYSYIDNTNNPSEKLTSYLGHNSRNIMRIGNPETRRKCLRTGRLQVVSFLSELPSTHHDLLGSSVDLTVYTAVMMMITVNGVFRETASAFNPKPIRSYHRTLCIVPQGSGYCIINDMLFVTNATAEQVEHAFKTAEVAAPAVSAAPANPAAAPVPVDAHKLQLVTVMSQQSGMNTHWSSECLQSSNWDFQRALQVFTQMHGEGKIPAEAFVK